MGGDGTKWKMYVNMPVDQLSKLRNRMSTLQGTLEDLHDLKYVSDWDGSLEDAVRKCRMAVNDFKRDPSMENENLVERWSILITTQPDYMAKVKKDRRVWEQKVQVEAAKALRELRQIVPACVRGGMSRQLDAKLQEHSEELRTRCVWSKPPIRDTSCCCHPLTGVPYLRPGPRRLLQKQILWLVWFDKPVVANMKFRELQDSFWYHNLDLREMLAIYAVLPRKFNDDGEGLKRGWFETFRSRLVELTELRDAGQLSDLQWRHPGAMLAPSPASDSARRDR